MKKHFSFLIVLLGLLHTHPSSASTERKVFTMNVHCFKDNWKFRFQHILDHLLLISPDVIAFQEVCVDPVNGLSQLDFIRNYLSSRGYPIQTFEGQYTHLAWDRFDEYLLVISKNRSEEVEKGFLPTSPLQRGYISLNIEGTRYINLHLEFREVDAPLRKKQVEFLLQRFQETSHILLGDFNSSPGDWELEGLKNAGYLGLFPAPGPEYSTDASHTGIDGYWISPKAQGLIEGLDPKIMLDQPIDGQSLSDHFAVFLGIRFR